MTFIVLANDGMQDCSASFNVKASSCGLPPFPLGFFAPSIVARDLGGSHRGLVVRRGIVLYAGSAWFSSGVVFGRVCGALRPSWVAAWRASWHRLGLYVISAS